nr:unnamed protein product [Callosobruchus analis]
MPVKAELKEEDEDQTESIPPWLKCIHLDDENEQPKKRTARIRGSFVCTKCNRMYIRKDSLQRHLKYECGKEPQFPCPFCEQKSKRRTHQLRHIKRRHQDKLGILRENNPELFMKIEESSQND